MMTGECTGSFSCGALQCVHATPLHRKSYAIADPSEPAVVDAVVPIAVTPEQSGVVAMLRAQQQVHATAVPNES
eukprot:m.339256 g.339256  ORF g.339256 m.339256 type:complete len:74 (-) comp27814_c1_seq4:3504-3725(-)